jgi:tRNA(Ile)-lysidine synthase
LLDEPRAQLRHYAHAQQLNWIEDPSNVQQRFARNRVRATVLPVLEQNFPGASAALAQVARLQSEVVEVLDALADRVLGDHGSLPLASLHGSAAPLRPYLIKRWLARRGAPPPGRAQLQQLLNEMLMARRDGQPAVVWRGVAVRRHDDQFFLTAAVLPVPSTQSLDWCDTDQHWTFAHGELCAQRGHGVGLNLALLAQAPLTLRYRQGGERLRLHTGGPRQELKHLFQQWRIPPWQRARWPLIYVGERLAAVAGRAVAAEFLAAGETASVVFEWQPRD